MTIGYLPMSADLFHVGHLRAIEQCYKLCDVLVIGLLSDAAIKKYKGSSPIIPYNEREEIIKHSGILLVVAKQHSINPNNNLKEHKIDVMFSSDGFEESEKRAAKKHKVRLEKFDYYKKQSTTKIKKKIYDQTRSEGTKKTTAPVSSSKG